ncbi:hypothetical protein FACS1894192_10600 [Bacilli bacterium]|nr:hypothetical protein FACS1894192_10600 [Bacilli bacterium]GHU45280.1 hypothetical protein FACS1894194_0690 [Bacilli bacterium]
MYENTDETPVYSISFVKSELSIEVIELIQNGAVLTRNELISVEDYISRYTKDYNMILLQTK